MESGNGFVLWALLKMNGRGDGHQELFPIYKKLRLRDEAMACERCLGQLLGEKLRLKVNSLLGDGRHLMGKVSLAPRP